MEMDEFDDMDDMDDLDNFDLPVPKLGLTTQTTEPSLQLLKNVSFGPVRETSGNPKMSFNPPISMKKVVNSSFGEDKSLPNFGGEKSTQPLKGSSIASFLKESLKPSTLKNFNGISASATAFLSSNPFTSSKTNNPFRLTPSAKKEDIKLDTSMEMDELGDIDDMDLDNIEEPSLK
mmetsp:Transcript_22819/g.20294  ORF Transcript_22819/g.20294 Transcript_22819/m.20294 type:complete len:176 (-) Transcript_22819:92-619(-)